ncbi:MAG TPA: serine/threonine-protein kinase [Polyangiaceae bacterium]|nr:serine/threonine-protein kinase [Polyangiaceae bacterium]
MLSVPSAAGGGAAKPTQIGKYALLGAIGRGGMADVFLAMAHGPSGVRKLVVVKCMRAGSELDSTLSQAFLEEGRLAALLNHANVVHTYEVGQGDEGWYIAMEYLHGQALSAIQRVAKPLAPRIAARIAADALSGLHYVHELRDLDGTPLSIVHRDLNPPNIFLTHEGVVKLVDFGIAKTAIATRASTEAGIVKGKLAYMAPEQTTGTVVDRRADIYALGVVLWELLAARRLVEDLSPISIVRNTLHGTIPLVSSIRPEIDPALARIVDRALRRDPEARYATALAMREDLEEFLAQSSATGVKELGQLMAEHFSSQREQRERQIQNWVAAFTPEQPAAPEQPAEPEQLAAPEPSPAPEPTGGSELTADGKSAGLAPLAAPIIGPPSEEPHTRRIPLRSKPRFSGGALAAAALLLAVTVFALLTHQRRPAAHAEAAESALPASAARSPPPDSKPSELEVVTRSSLASDSIAQPSSSRSLGSPPSAKSALARKPSPSPSPSPRLAQLPEAAPFASHSPAAAIPTQTLEQKPKTNLELERNPYMH